MTTISKTKTDYTTVYKAGKGIDNLFQRLSKTLVPYRAVI
uniref:Uncharacterized protein n=1 Tax=Anguilla anguilla TaxID=7936 RepID=A0A0E9RPW0_ANGAN